MLGRASSPCSVSTVLLAGQRAGSARWQSTLLQEAGAYQVLIGSGLGLGEFRIGFPDLEP